MIMGNHEGETKEERKLRRQKKKELKEQKRKRKRDETSPQKQSSAAVSSAIDQPSKEMKVEETTNSVPPSSQTILSPSFSYPQKEDLSKSPFQKRTIDCIISLQPSALVDITKALNQSMKNRLLQYFASYGGVLLSFENLSIISKSSDGSTCGLIWNEMPHMNFIVRVDILIFCPDVGIKLTGEVNESFPSHVGLLVHSYFNAVVHADHLRDAGYIFDNDLNEWKKEKLDGEDDPATSLGQTLGIGVDIEFTVEKIHEASGIISLEGSEPKVNFN